MLYYNKILHISPKGIERTRIKPRLGPLVGWIIVPPFTVTSELWTGIPPILFPVARALVKDVYWVVAWFEPLDAYVFKLPPTMTDPCKIDVIVTAFRFVLWTYPDKVDKKL